MKPTLEKVRILLVEDDPIIALDLRQILEDAGATVIGPAPDATSAMAILQNRAFDAAVLDHLIVGGDSVPVADELSRRGVRFLFHTSHPGRLSETFPGAPVINKPSRPGELVAAIKALVNAPHQIE